MSGNDIMLVGAGPMSEAYLAALKVTHPTVSVTVAGRGEESAARFEAKTGIRPNTGPLEDQLLRLGGRVRTAIVAVQVDQLAPVARQLLDAGFEHILLEKPGAATVKGGRELAEADTGDRIRIAYNRRFLTSSRHVRRLVAEDGGTTSFSFEFTEVADRIAATHHIPLVKANWALANSSHVMDMAFDLAGAAEDMSDVCVAASLGRGSIVWHPRGERFAGCGTVRGETLFSYAADWGSGGGWAVEIVTPKRRLIMRPLETILQQERGSFVRTPVEIEAEIAGLKPGLPAMLNYFLDGRGDAGHLPTARDQAKRMAVFDSLLGNR